jgi:small-conductance mechanosensitive channel
MGIVVGIAVQHTLLILVAGIQITITESSRIDDTVIVENERGWIKEINITYFVNYTALV